MLIGFANSLALMLAALFIVEQSAGPRRHLGTLLQRLVPRDMLGRVASLDLFVSIAFMPVLLAIAVPLSLLILSPAIFVIAGIIPRALALIALFAGRMRENEIRHPVDLH